MNFLVNNEGELAIFAQHCAQVCHAVMNKRDQGVTIFLQGTLGAGKTTFSRYFLHALGHEGKVKSPTYTLVEEYDFHNFRVFHFDLYRLSDPLELEFMGIRDFFQQKSISLIEWAQRGCGVLNTADLIISLNFAYDAKARNISIAGSRMLTERLMKQRAE